jgi:sugar O-acyltransferase (sialic acid O-acetyltransferase NeuD family)
MGTKGIILIGGGGHAKVVFDSCRASDMVVRGFCDDNSHSALSGSIEHLGPISDAAKHDEPVVIGIGDVNIRRRVLETLSGSSRTAMPIIHPSAVVSASAELAEGVLIGPGAIVNADARIGAHAIINSGAIIEHDCRIGENTHIAPGTVLGGGVSLGIDTLVGMGARVLPCRTIGDACVIGAGAVVTSDVDDGEIVVGVPGRVMTRSSD